MMAYKERLHTKEVLLKSQVHPVRVGVSRELTHLPGGGGGYSGLYRYVPRNRVWLLRFLVLK